MTERKNGNGACPRPARFPLSPCGPPHRAQAPAWTGTVWRPPWPGVFQRALSARGPPRLFFGPWIASQKSRDFVCSRCGRLPFRPRGKKNRSSVSLPATFFLIILGGVSDSLPYTKLCRECIQPVDIVGSSAQCHLPPTPPRMVRRVSEKPGRGGFPHAAVQ